jgi:hypothetical protein
MYNLALQLLVYLAVREEKSKGDVKRVDEKTQKIGNELAK